MMQPRLKYGQTFFVGLAFMSISIFWAVYDNAVPLILEETFSLRPDLTGIVMGADNVLALFMLPLFGMLSDKTNSRIGRRMPYILAGTAIAVVSMTLLPFADQQKNFTLFIAALGVVLIAMASYRSPAVALMPDVTPKPLRSKGNGIINLMGAVGGAIVMFTTSYLVTYRDGIPNYTLLFLTVVGLMVLTVVLLLLTVDEPKAVAAMREQSAAMGIDEEENPSISGADSVKTDPAVRKSFLLILLSIFLWFMGYNAVISAFSRYANSVWNEGLGSSMRILLVAQVAAIITFIPSGFLASKFGRRKTILAGILLLAVGFGTAMLYAKFTPLIYGNFVLSGIGWALINVNSLPMVVDMSKGPSVGKYTGYYYFFSMGAQIITPYLSGLLITHLGYGALFPYSCLFVLLAFFTMYRVKHGDTRPLPKAPSLAGYGQNE